MSEKKSLDILLKGGVVTCFAYGQTGSGKTFTMKGIEQSAIETIFEDFEAKEMLEADQLDIYLIRGLNLIKNLYKMGESKKEIEKTKKQIIQSAINDELFRI